MNNELATFQVHLESLEGPMVHHAIPVPADIAARYCLDKGPTRILCSIEGSPEFPCALNPRHGRQVIMASLQLIKKHKLTQDKPFTIAIRIDPHNGLKLPEELSEVLEQDDFGRHTFEKLNDGHKRGLIYYVSQAKSIDTRIKRSFEIVEKLKIR